MGGRRNMKSYGRSWFRGKHMRAIIITVVAAGLLGRVGSPASGQGVLQEAFFTPPLGDAGTDNTFGASFVNTGTAPVELTTQLCDLDGVCTTFGPSHIARGEGSSVLFFVSNKPLYAKFLLRPIGGGLVDGLGSLSVSSSFDRNNSAAVQTIRNRLLEKLVTGH
jgi:hypothetical protein